MIPGKNVLVNVVGAITFPAPHKILNPSITLTEPKEGKPAYSDEVLFLKYEYFIYNVSIQPAIPYRVSW